MIDGIRASLPKNKVNLSNCIYSPRKNKQLIDDCRSEKEYERPVKATYALTNMRSGGSFMVEEYFGGMVAIVGSIRKWYFGKCSFKDLTIAQFSKAIKELADALSISFEDLLISCHVTKIELGLNFITHYSRAEVIASLVKFGKVRKRKNYQEKDETHYFEGSDKNLKIYDKAKESVDKANKKIKTTAQTVYDCLLRHNLYCLRLEITMQNAKSFKRHGLKVETLSDLLNNWENLYFLFVREVAKIGIFNPLQISGLMTKKERRIADMIQRYGYEDGCNKYSIIKNTDEARVKRDGLRIMEKYPHPDSFSKRQLRKDIAAKLIGIHRYREHLPLSKLYHLLWRTKLSRKNAI